MNSERWQKIESVFAEALERDPTQRSSFLDEACGGDAELRDEVDRLLQRDETAELFEFHGPDLRQALANTPTRRRLEGQRLGAYEIQREIGCGGMGSVYLAVRTTDYRQQVAIKLVKAGIHSEEMIARARTEIQVLAALGKHPNIAALFDAGTTNDGQPYLVMEYIEGEQIDRFCDARKLSIQQRLDLFL